MACRCEKCSRKWDDQLATENEFHCTRKCGGRLVLVEKEEHTRRPADSLGVKGTPVVERSESPGVYRGERLLPLIPKLPATLAIMLDEYTREECGAGGCLAASSS